MTAATGSTLALIICSSFASATVFEYGAYGEVIVHNRPDATSNPAAASNRSRALSADRLRYRALAEQVALRYAGHPSVRAAGLDALTFTGVFVALVDQESRFNPQAVSHKGAQGLGQLMPGTAAELGIRNPFDPAENLDGAARYFTAQIERFGDIRLALAAYNAGPHRVVEYGGIPPFRETRNYVSVITAAAGLVEGSAKPAAAGTVSPKSTERSSSVWEF